MSPSKKDKPTNQASTPLPLRLFLMATWVVLISATGLFILATADHELTDRLINKITRKPATEKMDGN